VKCAHLIIVAGLPCSGKSHLLTAIESGHADHVRSALDVDRSVPLHIVNAITTVADELSGRQQVLLHYDLFAREKDADQRLQQLAGNATRLSFLTVVVPAVELRKRHRVRLVAFLRSLGSLATWRRGRVWFRMRRHRALHRLYREDEQVLQRYAAWMKGSERFSAEHWVVDCSDEAFRCVRAADTVAANMFGAA
jgi:hypothetical protein